MSDRAYNTVQALALEQNPEKLQEYLADPKKQQLYAMHQGIESLHAQLNQVSRIRNIIEKDPNLSPEEKRQKVNELLANVEATLRAMPIRKQRAELE
jgi:type II secretory pathway component PulC